MQTLHRTVHTFWLWYFMVNGSTACSVIMFELTFLRYKRFKTTADSTAKNTGSRCNDYICQCQINTKGIPCLLKQNIVLLIEFVYFCFNCFPV